MRLIRMFRNLKLSAELRMIAFSILMENPTVEVVHLCARHVYREPSVHVRGFVYDVLVAIRRTQYPYSKEM